MSEVLGTIKFLEGRIIIKRKDGSVETWSRAGSDDSNFISYQGYIYKLLKNNEPEVKEPIKKYQEIEEDEDDLDDESFYDE